MKFDIKKDLSLNNTSSCSFYHSEWEKCKPGEHVSIPYTIYRFLFMIFFIFAMLFSTLCQSHLFEIYLTNWSYTIQTLYGIVYFATIIWTKRAFFSLAFCQKYRVRPAETAPGDDSLPDVVVDEGISAPIGEVTNEEQSEEQQQLRQSNGSMEEALLPKTIVSEAINEKQSEQEQLQGSTEEGLLAQTMDSPVTISMGEANVTTNIRNHTTILEKFVWILMNIAQVLPHFVSIGYWVFVYTHDPCLRTCEAISSHFIVHSGTAVWATIDSMVVAIPARITHFIFPWFVLSAFALFSYKYEVFGGPYDDESEPYIYSVLNWRNNPGFAAIMIAGGTVVSPFFHTIFCFGFGQIRLMLVKLFRK